VKNPDLKKADYIEVHQRLASELNITLTGNNFVIPESQGRGYAWAEKLPSGITLMVSETSMNENFLFSGGICSDYSFCLQFNDAQVDPHSPDRKITVNRNVNPVQTSVKISDTSKPVSFMLPAGITLRSVKLFFNRDHLIRLIRKSEVEYVLSQYFEFMIKNDSLEPIDTTYRETLNELLVEKINHPLRYNYIQNRVLLLIEKFILKLHSKKDLLFKNVKNNNDEIARLMRIEALLVGDFSVNPPTIIELSKISAMSPTKLKTDFKSLYGMPIYEYYQKNRMLRAKSLILLAKYSIKEVGVLVGYSNLSHFANTFRKEFGVLPSGLTSKGGVVVYS